MQRKVTKQSRGPNSTEKAHMKWIKERMECAACHAQGPVICHHMYGATAKVKVDLLTVMIGSAAVLGLCQCCDNVVTKGSRRAFVEAFGPQNRLWLAQYECRPDGMDFPDEVVRGIMVYE